MTLAHHVEVHEVNGGPGVNKYSRTARNSLNMAENLPADPKANAQAETVAKARVNKRLAKVGLMGFTESTTLSKVSDAP